MGNVLVNNVRGNKVTETLEFVLEECCNCGLPFFIPTYLQRQLIASKEYFYCPSGHPQAYSGKTADQKKIDELEDRLQSVKMDRQQIENTLLDTINEKNKLSRQLKRVHKGVCPCCNRTFENLQRHMASKHPELAK